MTEPIPPDDTAALVKIVQRVTRFDGCIPATVAIAIAEAVCPDDCVVVRRDDLEDVASIASEADVYIDRRLAALDRIWELLRGEEE